MQLLDWRQTILQVLKNIDHARPIGVRPKFWDRVWSEEESPPYFNDVVRIGNDFYEAPGYEERYLQSLLWTVAKYVEGDVHEFGCGPGRNLQVFGPRTKGYDWSESACETVRRKGFDAEQFNMLEPHKVNMKGTLLTVHAMEQLGKDFCPFLDFILREKPKVCIHIEPIVELYDDSNLLDYLAKKYHKKRKYLEGFFDVIEGKIIDVQKSNTSGMMHNAYTTIVWKP